MSKDRTHVVPHNSVKDPTKPGAIFGADLLGSEADPVMILIRGEGRKGFLEYLSGAEEFQSLIEKYKINLRDRMPFIPSFLDTPKTRVKGEDPKVTSQNHEEASLLASLNFYFRRICKQEEEKEPIAGRHSRLPGSSPLGGGADPSAASVEGASGDRLFPAQKSLTGGRTPG